jgi:hypothetical protein
VGRSYLSRYSNGPVKQTYRQLKKFFGYLKNRFFNQKVSNIKVAITEMYPRISSELVADPLESEGISRAHFGNHCSKWSYKRSTCRTGNKILLIITLLRLLAFCILFECLLLSKSVIVIFFYTWKILSVYSGIKGFTHIRKPRQHSNIITFIWINTEVSKNEDMWSLIKENTVSTFWESLIFFLNLL